ncbi:MAG TPA: hypothetical protein VFJ16_11960 [Longimicrobium sp.]|nr:hypothetical protein [Longimicrobium sp.]
MRVRTLSLTLLSAAALAACGSPDLGTGPELRQPAEPAANHISNNCVHFNVPPVGATFGAPAGQAPGTVVWAEQAIRVSVNKFITSGGGSVYDRLRIEPAPAPFTLAVGNTGHTLNLNAGFDFTTMGWVTSKVVLHYMKFTGGYENLVVNGSPVFVGQITAPPGVMAGATVTSTPVGFVGGVQGTLTVSGVPINQVLLGGTSLWIDTVCAF